MRIPQANSIFKAKKKKGVKEKRQEYNQMVYYEKPKMLGFF